MSVGSIVLPTSRCQRNFMIHSTSHESCTHMRKWCSRLVFRASRCTARGLEGPAVIHQGVSQVRAWISFSLQPLVQSHWKRNMWGLSYVRHWNGGCAANVAELHRVLKRRRQANCGSPVYGQIMGGTCGWSLSTLLPLNSIRKWSRVLVSNMGDLFWRLKLHKSNRKSKTVFEED